MDPSKSGIVTSVNVLGKLLVDQSYLNNPLVQRNLDAIINKKTGELSIEAEFASKVENIVILYKYAVTLKKIIPANMSLLKRGWHQSLPKIKMRQ